MKAIFSHSKDPYFNLATEEYLLKYAGDDFFFLYINDPSVIIGKHQNALAEVDNAYIEENGILLARRISGGGAVYHDHGNINYSFITTEKPGDYIRFKTYTQAVIAALGNLGLEITLGKRNELLLGEKKISGTASHVFKNRVIHHGTLLFDTKLDILSKCLYVDNEHLEDKAVKSVRSEVTNLKSFLGTGIDSEDFAKSIFDFISNQYFSCGDFILNDTETEAISTLVREKFSQWDWNYAYSPKYMLRGVYKGIELSTLVLKGKIESIQIEGIADSYVGDGIPKKELREDQLEFRDILEKLVGERHDKSLVASRLREIDADPNIAEGLF